MHLTHFDGGRNGKRNHQFFEAQTARLPATASRAAFQPVHSYSISKYVW